MNNQNRKVKFPLKETLAYILGSIALGYLGGVVIFCNMMGWL